jgi:NDP-sugar pyrophosphorylase family protein
MQAMILAAGLGTRLLPHSLIRPKPLFPILNQPLLLATIRRLQNRGFDLIVVNCHHLRRQVVEALQGVDGVIIQEEEIILGTGGGLRRALKFFRDEPLLVSNGDIYHMIDFLQLYKEHEGSGRTVTLAMHDCPRFNVVEVIDGKVIGFSNVVGTGKLAFTGLHVIDPDILLEIEDGGFSCILDHYRKLLARNVQIGCFRSDGWYWTDMGTATDYLVLHQGLLTEAIPCWPEIGGAQGRLFIDEKAELGAQVELNDWVCVGKAHVGNGCHLQRVVVWDGVSIPAGARLADSIISTTFVQSQNNCTHQAS